MAALVMVLLIFSVAISVYNAQTQYQQLLYDQTSQVIQNLREDFGRALVDVLANFTQSYSQLAEMETPRFRAFDMYTFWTAAAARSFAPEGIQLTFNTSGQELVQPAGTFFGYSTPNEYVGNLTKLYWYAPQSFSAIYSTFDANITALGFYDWHEEGLYLLNVTMDAGPDFQTQSGTSINGVTYYQLNLTINRENGVMVDDLGASNFRVEYYDQPSNLWMNATLIVGNNGGGNYTLYVANANGQMIPQTYWKYLMLFTQDNRGIIVESYTYTYIDYTIQENALTSVSGSKPDETYDLEMLDNGTMLWYNTPLVVSGSVNPIPIPLAPVKQFRVNSTVNGPSDLTNLASNTVPSQVEVWNPDLLTPSLQFANWQLRFNSSEKLVFEINYGNAGIHQQTARICWLTDGDAAIPAPLVNITINGQFTDITNGQYTLRLVANGGYSVAIDWSMSMSPGTSYGSEHIEYTLTGVGWSPYPPPNGAGSWFPDILPYGTWTIIAGPIRAVAFRDTSAVWGSLNNTGSANGPWSHNETILIPYNTKYWQLYENLHWTTTYTDNVYYDFLTMISGGAQGGYVANWAYQTATGGVRWNSFASTNGGSPAASNGYTDFGYWYSQFQSDFGEAVMPSTAFVNSLTNMFGHGNAHLTPWVSGDYSRHVLDDDAMPFTTTGTMTLKANTPEVWTAGIWLFNGYTPGTFSDSAPQIYYKMFVEQYYPTIVGISAGI